MNWPGPTHAFRNPLFRLPAILIDEREGAASVGAAVLARARLDDGLRTTSEAAWLKLNANWVVLSACDTAAGNVEDPSAEGLSGLARAFFYAGARALLVSHWPVDDATTARLTVDTLRRAEADQGLGSTEALQAVMTAMLQNLDDPQSAHPSRWALFHLVGVGPLAFTLE